MMNEWSNEFSLGYPPMSHNGWVKGKGWGGKKEKEKGKKQGKKKEDVSICFRKERMIIT